MKFINTSAEWWQQSTTISQHIAKVGRICYKTQGKQPPANLSEQEIEEFIELRDRYRCKSFWDSGHKSMFRHGTVYYYIYGISEIPNWMYGVFSSSAYIDYVKSGKETWISTNMQYIMEHEKIMLLLEPYKVDEHTFITKAIEANSKKALMLLRMTIVCTTQRIQGESYNRKSPNCIAEQSTRYVNLDKKGGVQICRPHWEEFGTWYQKAASHFGYWVAEKVYQFLIFTGLKPEDARGNLTFNTYTVCAYTYNLKEWRHIIDMRLRNKTGKAHPDANRLAINISNVINNRMCLYIPNFTI